MTRRQVEELRRLWESYQGAKDAYTAAVTKPERDPFPAIEANTAAFLAWERAFKPLAPALFDAALAGAQDD